MIFLSFTEKHHEVVSNNSTSWRSLGRIRAEINSDVAEGVRKLNSSVKQLPVYGVKVAQQVEQHGIIALAYNDPELQRTGNAIGHEMGQGIRALANAMAKDMIGSARESNIH